MEQQQKTLPVALLHFANTPLGAFFVGALVLLASFTNYLGHNAYPVLAPESGLAILALLLCCALAALIYRHTGRYGRLAFGGLLVLLAFDLNIGTQIAAIAVVVHVLLLRDYTLPILGMMAATVLAGNLVELAGGGVHDVSAVTRSEAPAPDASDQPAIVHLMLDAHIGVEGLNPDVAAEAELAEDMARFYEANGFRLFGGAYSVHRRTVNSIPAIMNNDRDFRLLGAQQRLQWKTNRYFGQLAENGYRISVFQVDIIDFCAHARVHFCKTYGGGDPQPMAGSSLPVADKASVLLFQFTRLSKAMLYAAAVYDAFGSMLEARDIPFAPLDLLERANTSTFVGISTMDDLIAAVRDARPGDAYFAHILLPHQPFMLDRNCDYRGPLDWHFEQSKFVPVEVRQRAYAEQVRCVQKKMQDMLAALKSSAAGSDNVVIVHGDHGSRITDVEPVVENNGRYTDKDLISSYSTLFAVRASGVEPGYDGRPIPVHALFAEFLGSGFRRISGPSGADPRHTINMENRDWVSVGERELPETWTAR